MKVIGKTQEGFILDATQEDVANLLYQFRYPNSIKIGDEIDINKIYKKLKNLEYFLSKKEEIESMKKYLDDICSNIDVIEKNEDQIHD